MSVVTIVCIIVTGQMFYKFKMFLVHVQNTQKEKLNSVTNKGQTKLFLTTRYDKKK